MFYDHLSAHSPLTLGWAGSMRIIDEDEVGWKEKPEDTRYVKMITWSIGVQANDLIPNFAIIGNCWLGKVQVRHTWRHLAREGEQSRPGGAYNQVFNFYSSQTQGGGVQYCIGLQTQIPIYTF